MPVFSDLVVYIWLMPVIVQILLPLLMLFVWFSNRLIGKISDRKKPAYETMGVITSRSSEEVA